MLASTYRWMRVPTQIERPLRSKLNVGSNHVRTSMRKIREVLRLRESGLTVAEIARSLGIAAGTRIDNEFGFVQDDQEITG